MDKITNLGKSRLFWEKYRPRNLDDIALPDRIKKQVVNGITNNLLFYGPPGIGKTTLARVLVDDHINIQLNSKLGVETLRNEVYEFCMGSGIDFDNKPNKMKIVYLEEFDHASKQMQEEMRPMIEEFENRVRFVATCNTFEKIIPALHSRFWSIDFTPQNNNENSFIKKTFTKRIWHIKNKEDLNFSKEDLLKVVQKNFPDLRKCMQHLQILHEGGSIEDYVQHAPAHELYMLIEKEDDLQKVWNHLYSKWQDRLEYAAKQFGRQWWDWVEKNHPDSLSKMPNRYIIASEYIDQRLPNSLDPLVTLFAMITKIKQL